MPRTFTLSELYATTQGEYAAMSPTDRDAYDRALTAAWAESYARQCAEDFGWDATAAKQGVIES